MYIMLHCLTPSCIYLPGQAVFQGIVVRELGDDADSEGSVEARRVSPVALTVLGAAFMVQLKNTEVKIG